MTVADRLAALIEHGFPEEVMDALFRCKHEVVAVIGATTRNDLDAAVDDLEHALAAALPPEEK